MSLLFDLMKVKFRSFFLVDLFNGGFCVFLLLCIGAYRDCMVRMGDA